jgi:hypothetical protein
MYYFMIISFEDISVQNVSCFRCIRAPDVTPILVVLRQNEHGNSKVRCQHRLKLAFGLYLYVTNLKRHPMFNPTNGDTS